MANRAVILVRICKTENGWRCYPVALGKNGRIRPGWVLIGGEEEYFETGRYDLRSFEGRKLVSVRAGDAPAEALTACDRCASSPPRSSSRPPAWSFPTRTRSG